MSIKKRKYDYSYIEHGFTSININGEESPQYVICCRALTNDYVKPAKMKQHLLNVHPQHKDKNKSFFERHGNALKKMKLVSTKDFKGRNQKVTVASYVVTVEIAKLKKHIQLGKIRSSNSLSQNGGICFWK